MTTEQFDRVTAELLDHCKNTLSVKAGEYATSDRLHNFKVAAELQKCTPIQALAGMMSKHTVSVYDMCRSGDYPAELWLEKIGDSINYLLLLWAAVTDEEMAETVKYLGERGK